MGFEITERMLAASLGSEVTPQLVLEIEGHEDVYTNLSIKEVIRYGSPGVEYGDPIVYGGLVDKANQVPSISFQSGTTTQIKQTLRPDRGIAESISSMRIALVDLSVQITKELLKPDETETPTFDILGRRCKIWYGFDNTAFKEDFIIVFRGIIQNIQAGPGLITLQLNSPDDKKRSTLFRPAETELDGAITAGSTVLTVDSTQFFNEPTTGPDGLIDETATYFVKIDDEIIRYETKTGTQFQTLTRGALGTTATLHDDNAGVTSFVRLQGDAMTLALKLMFSGTNGPYIDEVPVGSFRDVGAGMFVDNAIFFSQIDVFQEYGVVRGDYITTTGATNGENNVSLEQIEDIVQTDLGSYIVIAPSTDLVTESTTSALVAFRSQFDTLGANDDSGAQMRGDEVDVDEHLFLFNNFLSSQDYDFYLEDEIVLKEFLSEQVYNPASCFSLPRKSKSSVGYHIPGQIPGTFSKVLNLTNVLNPSQLKIERSISKNFLNSIVYKFEEEATEIGKFLKIRGNTDADSLSRIDVGPKTLVIEAKGLRRVLGAEALIDTAIDNRLKKYKFGAEFIKGVKVNLKTGFNLEVGDTVILDMASLQVSDIITGTRILSEPRIFQIDNKVFDLRTGVVTFDIVDTNFERDLRYGLQSPCSIIKTGISTTQFVIQETGNSAFGANEYRKWEEFISNAVRDGTGLVIRSADFTTSAVTTLKSLNGNTVTVDPALPFTPSAGFLMESDVYDNAIDEFKLLFGFMTDDATFPDGESQYVML